MWNLPYLGPSINELIVIGKLLRTNQLKNSSHEGRNWQKKWKIRRQHRGVGFSIPRQKVSKAHCPNRMPAANSGKGAQLWSSKGFSRTPSGHPCTRIRCSPNKYQKSEQQEFLPAAHSWRDTWSSEQYFPDVETQWARPAWGKQGSYLSRLMKRVCG